MDINAYLEDLDSQIPAVQLLRALGWEYLSREQALALRDGREDRAVLTGVLRPWLTENNGFPAKGRLNPFSDGSIDEAVRRLVEEPFDGLVRTNERLYHLLTLGTSLPETVAGDTKGRTLRYIDWGDWKNNRFHVTDEFSVERRFAHATRRPDLVLFVNGIPFVVIECKRRDRDTRGERQVDAAIRQLLDYQENENIPQLFQYTQLLLATSVNEVRYGTVKTPRRFWSVWHEEALNEQQVLEAANRRLDEDTLTRLLAGRNAEHADAIRGYYNHLFAGGERRPTAQDQTFWAMLRPERLLDFVHRFVVFDAGVRKVARHQQYFAVKAALERALPLRGGSRLGGVIWHTTGSGKSLTMVMLAKALALAPSIKRPRVVLVTDRVDLDEQIWRTFEACGKPAARAKTGEELVRLVEEGQAGVITTVINKFDTVINRRGVVDTNPDIFVLVDEGHRSNYSQLAAHMRRVFPNACFIGFTGTPLHKKDKNTAQKFGGFIHDYTMRRSVQEGTVVPLLYEGRIADLEPNKKAIDAWFERLTEGLSTEQKADLKRKMSRAEVLHRAEPRIMMIAWDISRHYADNFKGTGLKAMLAADSRTSAVLYRKYFREFGLVESEVIMSKPDLRGEADEGVEEDAPLVARFWADMMERFGSEEEYNSQIKASFAREDGVEILIVVQRLLTGFDEPRNTVLYVDKMLKEHNILQAIARVNRLFSEEKTSGFVIDYRGVLGQLNKAVKTYDALADFDPEDVDLTGAVIDTHEEVARLPQRHSELWAVFKEVKNRKDNEAMERHLEPDDLRHAFYDALAVYQRTLFVALSTEHFYTDVPQERIEGYKADLVFFRSLRASAQSRFAETVDFSKYEKQIRRMMDTHIHAPSVGIITELVDIFDREAFDAEVERVEGKAAKADTIANRLKKTIREKMEEDPVFYKKFAELVQQAIDDYRQGRIDEAEYLKRVTSCLESVSGRRGDTPPELEGHRGAAAFFGLLAELMAKAPSGVREPSGEYRGKLIRKLGRERMAAIALDIERIIEERKVRDWTKKEAVIKGMEDAIDDYLYELRDHSGIALTTEEMDYLIERFLSIAKKQEGA